MAEETKPPEMMTEGVRALARESGLLRNRFARLYL